MTTTRSDKQLPRSVSPQSRFGRADVAGPASSQSTNAQSLLQGRAEASSSVSERGESARANGGKYVILVAGMHRSGTSALTRVLNLLGCDTARSLIPGDQFNEKGYWESREIADLNEAVLDSAGTTWRDWEPFNPDWYGSPKEDEFRERALAVLEDQFGAARFFVLKDPRVCRILPFWRNVIEAFGATPLVVSPIRNPVEIGESLLRRDGINPRIGQLLWLRHVLDAERDSRDLRRVYTTYDDLLADWQLVARRITGELGQRWPRRSTSSEVEIERFLSPCLRHSTAPDDAVLRSSWVSPWVAETYNVMRRWSTNREDEADRSTLDHIKSNLDNIASTFSRPLAEHDAHGRYLKGIAIELENRLNQEQASTQAKDVEIGELKQALAQVQQENANNQARVVEREAALANLGQELAAARNAAEVAQASLAQARNAAEAAQASLAQARAAAAESEAAFAERDEAVARLDRELRDARQGLATLNRLYGETARLLRVRNDEFLSTEQSASEAQKALDATRAELEHRAQELAELREAAERNIKRIQTLKSSVSWRVTAPIRTLTRPIRSLARR